MSRILPQFKKNSSTLWHYFVYIDCNLVFKLNNKDFKIISGEHLFGPVRIGEFWSECDG